MNHLRLAIEPIIVAKDGFMTQNNGRCGSRKVHNYIATWQGEPTHALSSVWDGPLEPWQSRAKGLPEQVYNILS